MLPCSDDYLYTKNLRYQLISSRNIVDQRIPQSDWTKGTPGNTQPKLAVLRCYLPSMIISTQKIKDIDWFLPVIMLIKES